jgi:hypothetical protein
MAIPIENRMCGALLIVFILYKNIKSGNIDGVEIQTADIQGLFDQGPMTGSSLLIYYKRNRGLLL